MRATLNILISIFLTLSACNLMATVEETIQEPGKYDIDMGTTHYLGVLHDFALLTFPKTAGDDVKVVELYNFLADCEFEVIQKSKVAVVQVNFDVENDGGFNSCTLLVTSGDNSYEVTLGAEVGE